MSHPTLYSTKCPLFDRTYKGGGVMFPYVPLALGQGPAQATYINLDGSASAIFARVRLPMTCILVTCQAFAVSDDQGTKAGAASTEPILAVNVGTAPLASIDAGSEIATITCDATGAIGDKWEGTTTETVVSPAQELIVHLKTAAVAGTSGNKDGGAVPVLWFAQLNAP